MSTIAISSSSFEEALLNNEILFLDFWAPWCAPCREFSRIYEQVAKDNLEICFATINIEEEQEIADSFQIKSIPHLMVFKQGIAIYSESGSMPESTLTDLVKQAKAADVSDVRAEIDNNHN